jgi:hypothetical protein
MQPPHWQPAPTSGRPPQWPLQQSYSGMAPQQQKQQQQQQQQHGSPDPYRMPSNQQPMASAGYGQLPLMGHYASGHADEPLHQHQHKQRQAFGFGPPLSAAGGNGAYEAPTAGGFYPPAAFEPAPAAAGPADDCRLRAVRELPAVFHSAFSFRCGCIGAPAACSPTPHARARMLHTACTACDHTPMHPTACRYFNLVQSECFDAVYGSDAALVVAAPTGSGKTGACARMHMQAACDKWAPACMRLMD